MTELDGKVAIITGAARGQGAAEARLFVAHGARVVLTDLDKDGTAVADELGDAAIFVPHDVSSAEDWAEVVRQALKAFGTIDILINNAGIYKPKPLANTDEANFDLHYRVNQRGVFLGMKAVLETMTAAGRGSIVNISSTAGMMNFPGSFAYSMTKWASRGMSKVAAFELAPLGIRVNSVHPGVIDTPMLEENPPGMLDLFKAFIPMQRSGTPDEVAELVMFLASDRASYITGAEISIAGGVC
ncbi:SDR family NAD(P)-dependent oxidoreductase [Actinomadura fibrosa]|uniref:SDR family NAD(P)-dependent oxidoreductase n=1 Tax=Actinomadura fibrosa TaxID=111802 RepID=A0ABW2XPP5_9ACTN|nr:glucose 1-dehydrogenase [Actinomadura fibrosa]